VSSYCRPEGVVVMVMTKRFQKKKEMKKRANSPFERRPEQPALANPHFTRNRGLRPQATKVVNSAALTRGV